jgi:hypothetical protein
MKAGKDFVGDSGSSKKLAPPGRVELPTNGLGNRCSVHLSYGGGTKTQ